ncbi:hypothetical protein Avbf_17942 [Armadillidium vulgare]|nr:hypothetical protein Avbf_17942 [Armadillidium vulgare]
MVPLHECRTHRRVLGGEDSLIKDVSEEPGEKGIKSDAESFQSLGTASTTRSPVCKRTSPTRQFPLVSEKTMLLVV